MTRPIAKIFTTPHFDRAYRGLPPLVRRAAVARDLIFRANALDPRLKTHPLRGKLKGLWAYSVDHSHRILFEFLGPDEVLYHDAGSHAIYG